MDWLEHLRRVIWEEESGYKYYFKKVVQKNTTLKK